MKKPRIKLIFKWFDFWVGFFWDEQKGMLYFFPIPMFGIVFKFRTYISWLNELKQIQMQNYPLGHKKDGGWHLPLWKKYYEEGFNPLATWNHYTRNFK